MPPTSPRHSTRLSRTAVALAWLLAAGGAIAALLIGAAAAEGGVYRVAQCHPGHDAGRGDFSFERTSRGYASSARCDDGRGLVVRHEARQSRGDRWGAWALEAPTGTELQGVRANVGGTSAAGHVPELLLGAPGAGVPIGRATGGVHPVRWSGTGASALSASLRCDRALCGRGAQARIDIRRIMLRLFDSAPPSVEPAGPLAGPATLRATQGLTPRVTDAGAGVRRVFVQVNDEPLAARRIECRVRRRVASSVRPCPSTAAPSFAFDTTEAPFHQGRNRLRVCALDLAANRQGNRDCATRRVRIDNQCPVDGSPAGVLRARLAGGGRTRKVGYGRPARVVGSLTDAGGEGIPGAEVCVATRVSLRGAVERVVATPATHADGRFDLQLDPGPSREVRIAHWSDSARVAERYLRLDVRSRPSLRVRPRRVLRNGERVRFAVRLHGPAAAGRRFHVKVRSGGGWHRLRTETTNAAGRWRGSYRFHATTGRRTYRFRAFVPAQHGYPYADGWSRTRKVRVRG